MFCSWMTFTFSFRILRYLTLEKLKITPILDKLLEYKRSWIQHVNRMPRNILPRVMKQYFPNWQKVEI